MDYNNLPLGLGIAIASNRAAMDRFVDLSDEEKSDFIERGRALMSQKELDEFVGSLIKEEKPDVHLEDVNDIFDGPVIG